MQVQIRRETMGGYLMFKATTRMLDVHGAVVLHRNDCVGALAALKKGSFASRPLQEVAVAFNDLAASVQTEHYFLHAPGVSLVDEGIDGASRETALQVLYPACTERLRSQLRDMARAQGWELTVDLFATEANALTARFYARFAEHKAEAVDALAVPSWDRSQCPTCGQTHREVVFAFPPHGLINPMIRKLAADGARGLVVVPTALTSAHWPRLLAAALPLAGCKGRYQRLRHLSGLLRGSPSALPTELSVFAVDFGPRPVVAADGDACAGRLELRRRDPLGSMDDQRDRATSRAALAEEMRRTIGGHAAGGTAARAGTWPGPGIYN